MEDGGIVTEDKIKVTGLKRYTNTKKSGDHYSYYGERKDESWHIRFSRKDGINDFGYAIYQKKEIEKRITLSELPKSLFDIYSNPEKFAVA